MGILVGDTDAKNSIVKICNTFCGYCSEAHKHIDYILENKPDFNVRIIYVIPDIDHPAAHAIKHLLAIAEMGDQNYTRKALDDWYLSSIKNYPEFAAKYPIKIENLEAQAIKLNKMSSLCKNAGIHYTPQFFINGYQIPENYKIEEIKHIL